MLTDFIFTDELCIDCDNGIFSGDLPMLSLIDYQFENQTNRQHNDANN